ncbi:hypothetical protein MLD38_011584 [Melastoma candidum]|uniref:Uncharacterized protein n=1 Tax=Melastoma candidum TaxID=119954 RepID=A0ACB9R6J2_9MYRT|nr:hypothetical protein MLD38_011584 [Melastoma candidum]
MPPKHDEVKFNPSIVELPVAAGNEPVELTEAADAKDQSEMLAVDMFSCEMENAKPVRVIDVVGDSPSAFPKLEDEIHEQVKVESHISDRIIYSETKGNGKDNICSGHEMFTCAAVLRSSLQNVNSPVKSLGLNPSGCQSCSSRCQKQPPIEPEEGIAK